MVQKVAKEVAESEFARFAEAMDLDVDVDAMDRDDLKEFQKQRRVFVRAVMEGHLAVNESGEPVFTPQSGGDPITFREPDGAAHMARDQREDGQNVSKLYAEMGAACGVQPSRFSKMKERDLKVCVTVYTFFTS